MDHDLPEHVRRNRGYWDEKAAEYIAAGETNWQRDEPVWGIWSVPESQLGVLPDVAGLDTIELGCGTGYVSAWLARRGAHPVGIDNSAAQLDTARRLQREHGLEFPLIHGNAETVPRDDAGFDLAISEYGACLWADPYKWVPEAARLLRPGGQLIFLANSAFIVLCMPALLVDGPAGDRLLRPYFGMYQFEWPDEDCVEFYLGYGDWLRLLRANGFEVEDIIEIQPPEGATTQFGFSDLEWARKWPTEVIWKARLRDQANPG